MSTIKEIQPKAIWSFFEEISQIPRLSKQEHKIIAYILDFAKKYNLKAKKDNAGNILIDKPASPGKENLKPVVLQSHLDMAGEKENGISHDFTKDPIIPYMEKGWITAKGTTLGADDGVGIAAQLVILSDNTIEHGPLECLFTVDEESGMTGAANLKPDFFSGEILLNLDSEDEGELFIGCAGGIDTIATFTYSPKKNNQRYKPYRMAVTGLKGGHSGDEIHKSPANAIKILNRFLWNAHHEFKVRISIFDGGNLRNAIPRDAYTILSVPLNDTDNFESFFQVYVNTITRELGGYEPNLTFNLRETDEPESYWNRKIQTRILNSIYACPHGVITWSPDLEGLVETSANLASIKQVDEKTIRLITSQRSAIDSAKKDISDRIASVFSLAGAKIEHTDGYPGWTPNPDSEIVAITIASYHRLFKKRPVVRAIHAGLECGLILEKYPGLDMISFGPTIKGVHTPEEKIDIKSTQRFWKLLLDVLKSIPQKV